MNGVVNAVNAITAFNSEMERLGITYDSLKKISAELVDISEYLNYIQDWRGNMSLSSDDIEETVTPIYEPEITLEPLDDNDVEEIKVKTKRGEGSKPRVNKQIQKKQAIEIAEFISEKCDGKTFTQTIDAVMKKWKDIPERAIQRLVKKGTFERYTDDYFLISNDHIQSLRKNLPDKFGASAASAKEIMDLLNKNAYDVIKTITPDMSANDILQVAIIRWNLFNTGKISTLGGGVKEIFIMEAISANRRANSNAVIKAINMKYNVDVDVALVSAVRTGRTYKEIAAKFGV